VQLLVTGENGRLDSGDLFTKTIWHNAFTKSNLAVDGMHALRHFYASALLAQGVSIKELAEYLGHSDPGFTLRTYTHLVPSSFQRARTAITASFNSGQRLTAWTRPDHESSGLPATPRDC
jgi:integrase